MCKKFFEAMVQEKKITLQDISLTKKEGPKGVV
jgi:hypothetical protein